MRGFFATAPGVRAPLRSFRGIARALAWIPFWDPAGASNCLCRIKETLTWLLEPLFFCVLSWVNWWRRRFAAKSFDRWWWLRASLAYSDRQIEQWTFFLSWTVDGFDAESEQGNWFSIFTRQGDRLKVSMIDRTAPPANARLYVWSSSWAFRFRVTALCILYLLFS